ncbi:twitching motility protein PilT, partial [Halorubrum tibetense]
ADLAGRARTLGVDDADVEDTDAADDDTYAADDDTYADDALVALAVTGRVDFVVTNDRPLTERVLDADTPVICLRGRNTLAITEP